MGEKSRQYIERYHKWNVCKISCANNLRGRERTPIILLMTGFNLEKRKFCGGEWQGVYSVESVINFGNAEKILFNAPIDQTSSPLKQSPRTSTTSLITERRLLALKLCANPKVGTVHKQRQYKVVDRHEVRDKAGTKSLHVLDRSERTYRFNVKQLLGLSKGLYFASGHVSVKAKWNFLYSLFKYVS